ncbi:HVA22-like protein k [Telopea speciosissima]|uniref:HVA22-like protein k n=1 Tax=Telopea speciosissima TaxID=54955 RepID=UPI001CC54F35|nr:HVA22-like protein k [Telopea speciosissima]
MAFLGSNIPSEVGLRSLLCPLGSNVVIRTACCSVGIVLPVYSTFKAIEKKDQNEQQKWLLYWAVYGSFSLAEVFSDKIISWVPMYYHMKFAFLVWLQVPSAEGTRQMYVNHLRPFLLRHQARLDQIVGYTYGEMVKFINAHQSEFQFARAVIMNIVASGNKVLRNIVHPAKRGGHRAIEGPTSQMEDSNTDLDN